MMNLSHDDKLKLMSNLNWDYLDTHEDMLSVIEGRLETSGAFTRDRLFVRSLERLPWHYVTALWGVETIKELYTEEIARRIWPKERSYHVGQIRHAISSVYNSLIVSTPQRPVT